MNRINIDPHGPCNVAGGLQKRFLEAASIVAVLNRTLEAGDLQRQVPPIAARQLDLLATDTETWPLKGGLNQMGQRKDETR